MPDFHFYPELFDARARLIDALNRQDLLWFRDYPTLDVLHDEYGLEVCGVQDKETALRIGWVMVETFPDWPYGALFLKEWGTGDPGWKVLIAKRPDVEGPAERALDGSRRAFLLRDVLRWPWHDPSERPGEEPDEPAPNEPMPDDEDPLSELRRLLDESPDDNESAAPQPSDQADANEAPADEQEGDDSSEVEAWDAQMAEEATFVRLEAQEVGSFESLIGLQGRAKILDRNGIEEFAAAARRSDSGLGPWVATAWLEFVAIGDEPVHPHREDHREVIEACVRYLADSLMPLARAGLWSTAEAVIFLPEARYGTAYAATTTLEEALNELREMPVARGEHRVTGIRTRMTLEFTRTGPGEGAPAATEARGAS